jgi:triacylglycerol lipase
VVDSMSNSATTQALMRIPSKPNRIGRFFGFLRSALKRELWVHVAQLPLGGLSMLVPKSAIEAQAAKGSKRPLVLVHGLGGHPGNFTALEAKLRLAGLGQIYRVDLRGAPTMKAGASKLDSMIEAILAVNGLPEDGTVDIIAHSMGGVMVRTAMLNPKVSKRVAKFITLGSPHHGSHLAWYLSQAVGPGAELSPDDALWSELAEQEPWLRDGTLTSFYTEQDCLVRPAQSCLVEGADNRERSAETHFSFLWSQPIFTEVLDVLRKE